MGTRIVHCWEPGPEAEDGCSTTCFLLDGHDGPHQWTRDEEITVEFAPAHCHATPDGCSWDGCPMVGDTCPLDVEAR